MVYITAALYCEAMPFIRQLGLKKVTAETKYQLFTNEQFLLMVTGSGPVAAAGAVSRLFTQYPLSDSDLLINFGICASSDSGVRYGTLFYCNRINDAAAGRTYYPDMLWKHPFTEGTVTTFGSPVKYDGLPRDGSLADMEAAAVYQIGSLYLHPHQMAFFKAVSDHGADSDRLTPQAVSDLLMPHVKPVTDWAAAAASCLPAPCIFSGQDRALTEDTADKLFLSAAMKHQLFSLLYYYKLAHGEIGGLLSEFWADTDAGKINCRKKGKKYFEQLKQRII